MTNFKNTSYYSELGETTDIDIVYSCSYNSKIRVKTTKTFSGRGITANGKTDIGKIIKNIYTMTENAFNKIKLTNDVCYEGTL